MEAIYYAKLNEKEDLEAAQAIIDAINSCEDGSIRPNLESDKGARDTLRDRGHGDYLFNVGCWVGVDYDNPGREERIKIEIEGDKDNVRAATSKLLKMVRGLTLD